MDDLLKELDSFDRSAPADRDRRRRFVATAAIAGLAFVGLGQLTTSALFTDDANASVSMVTGDVEIQAGGAASVVLPNISNMAPGDNVYRAVEITNVGSLDLRYAITGQTTNNDSKSLSDELRYRIFATSAATCNAAGVASLSPLVSNVAIGVASSTVLGNPAPGNQGDRAIPAGGSSDELCIGVSLPTSTTSAYAGASSTVELTFNAEQTKNN